MSIHSWDCATPAFFSLFHLAPVLADRRPDRGGHIVDNPFLTLSSLYQADLRSAGCIIADMSSGCAGNNR